MDSIPPTTAVDDHDWSVPTHTVTEFAPRRTRYCVLIPVINEGERIRELLDQMHAQGAPQLCDVVIVDGGSTDGSLDRDFLLSKGVRALVLKTGPGKLSAQLRCGYAWTLREGYDGIITIDGNGKDDPTTIPQFAAELDAGADFVQASRFVPGGVQENTPLARWIAIRFVHAPLLSLAAGFHWTDSTQGYRAYSRRMLLDPRVKPFRDVFITYELLAYLSCRVPRLGFQCKETPTARRYPADGHIPTKISSFRGNWDVLKILFAACLRQYDPPA